MKAKIKKVEYQKEYQTKFGTLHLFKVWYGDEVAFYSSKSKDQKKFEPGKEAEFVMYEKNEKGRTWKIIKPNYEGKPQSNYSRKQKAEQSRYSGFAASYIKDMLVGKILIPEHNEQDEVYNDIVMTTWKKRSLEVFEHMVSIDKTLLS